MEEHATNAKLLLANLLPWFGTIMSLQDIHVLVAIFSGLASMTLSIVSIFWVMRKHRDLDRKD
jgi:hypothetical protein